MLPNQESKDILIRLINHYRTVLERIKEFNELHSIRDILLSSKTNMGICYCANRIFNISIDYEPWLRRNCKKNNTLGSAVWWCTPPVMLNSKDPIIESFNVRISIMEKELKLLEEEGSVKEQSKNSNMKKEFPVFISSDVATKLILAACGDWQKRLMSEWGVSVLKQERVRVSEEIYRQMRKESTASQHQLLDEVFGPDEEHPKDGTPCLIYLYTQGWLLRYANGKGEFYLNGRKKGSSHRWYQWMILDMNNLPVIE